MSNHKINFFFALIVCSLLSFVISHHTTESLFCYNSLLYAFSYVALTLRYGVANQVHKCHCNCSKCKFYEYTS